MHRRLSAWLASAACVAGVMSASDAAWAQSAGQGASASPSAQAEAGATIAEVVVTAQRRSERQVDVPIAITSLGTEQLAAANVQELGDIARVTPSLRFDNQAGFFQPSIRGIGTGIATSGGGSNVGIYIDGFYSPNPLAADFQLTKVESIQVLKGPQGTLFGRNTTGGAILVTTADPSTDPELQLKASYARFDAQRYQAYGTFGLSDRVAMDLEGIYSKGDGFLTNILDGDKHVAAYENWTIRTGLKAEITDRISVLARYTHSDVDDPSGQMLNSNVDSSIDPTTGRAWGVQTFQVPGFFTTDPDEVAANLPRIIRTRSDIAQLTIRADLGFADLTSYSQYRREKTNQSNDLDQTGLPIFQLGLPVSDKTYSQEFLLTSRPGPRLQWTAGAFFFSNRDVWQTYVDNAITTTGRVRLGGSGTTTQSYAAFFDATYQVNEQLFVTGGLRYSHDIVKDAYWNPRFSTAKNPEDSINGDRLTPRVVVRYKPTEESSVYASYTKGYKAAIIDVGGSCQNAPAFECSDVKPESIDAFEIGYKFQTSNLAFETSAFYYDYKNLQVSEYIGAAQAFIVNAAKSEIYGVDAALRYNFGRHLQVNLGGAWTHARYKEFGTTVGGTVLGAPLYASCPADPASLPAKYAGSCGPGQMNYVNTDTVLRDVHMQRVPDFTANLGVRYTTGMTDSGEFSLAGNLYYTSKFYFSPSGTQFRQPGYATLALRGEWVDPTDRYTVALFGENVTDERYRTQVQFNAFGIGAQWSQPATWGVEVAARF